MNDSAAPLDLIRSQVDHALQSFVDRCRSRYGHMFADPTFGPVLATAEDLLSSGKRLRPAFCYWGWRGAGGGDIPQIRTAAASLELLQASALVHDDYMDASDTRRGRPTPRGR